MYNQYNPYLNRFYGQQQANMPQPMEMPIQQQNTPQMALNRQNILYGKQVDSLEVVKAIDIPLDGSVSYFPLANGSAIVTKQLQADGTSRMVVYKPIETKQPKQVEVQETYITEKELDEKLSKLDNKELKEEIEKMKKQIKDLMSNTTSTKSK